MTILRLWRSLNRTRVYTINRYLAQVAPASPLAGQFWHWLRRAIRDVLPYLAALIIILLVLSGRGPLVLVIIPTLVMLLLIASLPLVPGTIAGVMCASSVARAVNYQHTLGRYEAIASTPLGAFGLHWTLAQLCVTRNRALRTVYGIGSTVYTFLALMFGFLFILLLMFGVIDILRDEVSYRVTELLSSLNSVLQVAVLAGVVLLLQFQLIASILSGLLIGMITTTYVREQTLSQLIAAGGFLLQQLLDYALLLLTLYLTVQALYNHVNLWQVLAVGLGFVGIRQGIVYGLLRMLIWRLGADRDTAHLTI